MHISASAQLMCRKFLAIAISSEAAFSLLLFCVLHLRYCKRIQNKPLFASQGCHDPWFSPSASEGSK